MNCLYGTVKEEIIWILIVCVTLCWGVPIPWSDSRSHNHHLIESELSTGNDIIVNNETTNEISSASSTSDSSENISALLSAVEENEILTNIINEIVTSNETTDDISNSSSSDSSENISALLSAVEENEILTNIRNEIAKSNETTDDISSSSDASENISELLSAVEEEILHLTKSWVPQEGNMIYPKSPELSPVSYPGDIYLMDDGNYYQAQVYGNISDIEFPDNDIESTNPSHWLPIRKGSFLNPRSLSSSEPIINIHGDVYYDAERYYVNQCNEDSSGEEVCEMRFLHVKSNWMKLTYEQIKHNRISDLQIPGTHDSASWGITEDRDVSQNGGSGETTTSQKFQKNEAVERRVQWVYYWWPDTLLNWTMTQNENLLDQLEAGFRELDLRITDMGEDDGGFLWWHILTADPIEQGLKQVRHFVQTHPDEVIILDFQHLKRPSRLKPITEARFKVLTDIILGYLRPYTLTRDDVQTTNPTIAEVLSIGKNILTFVEDPFMQSLSSCFWPKKILHSDWEAKSNPEALFLHRSEKLIDYKHNYPNSITDTSGSITMDHDSISIGQHPGRSFEGQFPDLIKMARYGANTGGMQVRDPTKYSSGKSVHYRGVNDMYRYWVARPNLYKPNIIYSDDSVKSSTIVDTAIEANLGQIKPEVAVTYQGSPQTGFYEWFEGEITGAEEATMCEEITGRFIISSQEYGIQDIFDFKDLPELVITKGSYPPDAEVLVDVTQMLDVEDDDDYDEMGNDTDTTAVERGNVIVVWHRLYENNIDFMIEENLDLYVRGGVSLKDGKHFGYISKKYNLFGETCTLPPYTGFENILYW